MRKILTVFVFVSVSILFLSSCVTESYLVSSPETDNSIIYENGNDYQKTSSADLSIKAAGRKADNGYNSVLFEITNLSDNTYPFRDSQITFLGGNKDLDSWHEIGNWDSHVFFEKQVRSAKATQTAVDVIGVLAVIDEAIFNPYETVILNSDDGSKITYRYYDPSNIFFTALMADMMSYETERDLRTDLNFLKQTLLFSSDIESNKSYSGIAFFPMDNKYPDYKIVFNAQGKTSDFIFSRTDREEILHPWSCDRNRTVFSLTYTHSLLSERMGIDSLWLAPKGIGCYMGVYTDYKNNIDSWPFGLTVKCIPHTWLLLGFETGVSTDDDTEKWLLAPQAGVNISFNWADALFKCSYDIPSGKFIFDAGLGISF